MSAFSDDLEAKIVLHFLVGTEQPAAGQLHLALFTEDPGESGYANEATYTGYLRQPITFTSIDSNGDTKNDGVIQFPPLSGASQIIKYAAVYDQSDRDAGIMVLHGKLASDKQLDDGDVLSFADNALVLTVT